MNLDKKDKYLALFEAIYKSTHIIFVSFLHDECRRMEKWHFFRFQYLLSQIACNIWDLCIIEKLQTSVTHIPGVSNKEADKQGRMINGATEREGKPRAT